MVEGEETGSGAATPSKELDNSLPHDHPSLRVVRDAPQSEANAIDLTLKNHIAEIAPGKDDGYGNTVHTVILRTDDFAVWLADQTYDVWWETVKNHSELPKDFGEVTSTVAQLEAIQIKSLPEDVRRSFRCLVGEGMARAFEGDVPAAIRTLEYARSFVTARLEERTRLWHLMTAVPIGLLASAAFIWIGLMRTCGKIAMCNSVPIAPVYCACMGVIGAMFSLVTRAGSISADPAAGKHLHVLEVAARLVVGGAAGLIASLAIFAGIIMSQLKDGTLSGLLLVGFVAGVSERFIPNLVRSVESQTSSLPGASSSTTDQQSQTTPKTTERT